VAAWRYFDGRESLGQRLLDAKERINREPKRKIRAASIFRDQPLPATGFGLANRVRRGMHGADNQTLWPATIDRSRQKTDR